MLSSPRLLGLVCLLTAPLAPGAAQGWIEPIRPLPAFPRGAIVKVRSAVQVTLTGRAARVTVEEWFRNAGPVLDEANYLYPLAGEAVFSDFSLWQGDRELKGEPMDANQARAIYEDIVRRKRDPAEANHLQNVERQADPGGVRSQQPRGPEPGPRWRRNHFMDTMMTKLATLILVSAGVHMHPMALAPTTTPLVAPTLPLLPTVGILIALLPAWVAPLPAARPRHAVPVGATT